MAENARDNDLSVPVFEDWPAFERAHQGRPVWAFSTRAGTGFDQADYHPGDALLFGPETRGLPDSMLQRLDQRLLRIPMRPGNRSLNLSNAVAVAVFEAWRRFGYRGA